MKISDIDKNFAVKTGLGLNPIVWLDAKEKPFRVHGLAVAKPGTPFLRMPAEVAASVSDGVNYLNTCTAGGRIRFRTNSPWVTLRAEMPQTETMLHMTFTGQSGFDCYENDGTKYAYHGTFFPTAHDHGYETWLPMDGKWHTYTINMPLYDGVNELMLGLHADAQIEPAEDYTYPNPILYYGSSITQGGCASRPGNAYQALISRRFDADFINLGFSGNAKAEETICRYLASLDASVFVCDYDHNAPNPEHLEKTHKPLYETYRAAHPDTPIIFVTKPDFYAGTPDERRREIVIATYEYALSQGDRRVQFVDGATLFDGPFRDSCTVDGCHPNDLGFYRMAQKIGDAVEFALQDLA